MSLAQSIIQAQTYVIAEVAQTHDGSLGQAHAFVDAVATTGVQAIKFQAHIAEAESTLGEPFRVKFSRQDENRFDYWKRMEFSAEQWAGLYQHCRDKELEFLCSPFSLEALEMLERLGISAWKIGSGETNNPLMLEAAGRTKKPVLLSSGMSPWSELDEAVRLVRTFDCPLVLFQCTSSYPTPPERVGLNVIPEMAARYGCPVGLSDHSGTIYPSLAALVLGARFFEVHVTLSRHMFGPDVSSSVTVEELKQLHEGVRFLSKTLAAPVDKDGAAREMEAMRAIFQKSVVARSALSQGHSLRREDMTIKKPGGGIPAAELSGLVGAKLLRDLERDEQIRPLDVQMAEKPPAEYQKVADHFE